MAIIKVDISRNLTHPSVLACETIGGPKKVKGFAQACKK